MLVTVLSGHPVLFLILGDMFVQFDASCILEQILEVPCYFQFAEGFIINRS